MKKLICLLFQIFISFNCAFITAQEYQVLGIGAPAMDILMRVEDEFLQGIAGDKGGSSEIDWKTFSEIMKYSKSNDVIIATGGSAANTIKGLASLKLKSAFFGKIGNDEMGLKFASKIKSLGVIPLLIETNVPTTQIAALITPDGQRTLRYFLGASKELTEYDLTSEMFKGVKLVHIEIYAIYQGNLVEKAMKLAKQAGAAVSIDLGSFEMVKQFKSRLLDLIPNYVDIVFANEDEIKALTGLDPENGCEFLKTICPIAVVKLGKHGCWVMSASQKFQSPGFPVSVVRDTTGAGDHFASGFLYGFLEGCSLEMCARYANLLGSAAVEVYGAEIPESKWIEIRKHFAEQ